MSEELERRERMSVASRSFKGGRCCVAVSSVMEQGRRVRVSSSARPMRCDSWLTIHVIERARPRRRVALVGWSWLAHEGPK